MAKIIIIMRVKAESTEKYRNIHLQKSGCELYLAAQEKWTTKYNKFGYHLSANVDDWAWKIQMLVGEKYSNAPKEKLCILCYRCRRLRNAIYMTGKSRYWKCANTDVYFNKSVSDVLAVLLTLRHGTCICWILIIFPSSRSSLTLKNIIPYAKYNKCWCWINLTA